MYISKSFQLNCRAVGNAHSKTGIVGKALKKRGMGQERPRLQTRSFSDVLFKLLQEAQIVVEKQANIVNRVFQHGEALNAHPEGKAAVD